MLRSKLIHPTILGVLGAAGHGSRVLIADGNYPFSTGSNPEAELVFLNLMPGKLTVIDVLEALISAIPVEAAHVMQPYDGSEPPIFAEFRQRLPEIDLQKLERFDFYEAARGQDVALVIATGEQRVWANIMLTIGVVPPA
ncbi:MAG: RbsD or FucU transport [Chloroflexi bacterium]|nr:RbsD or FucU transport [Chloroflexota bacterium]